MTRWATPIILYNSHSTTNQMKCTNHFLYSDDIWCIIPIRKESLKRNWFHASIHHVHTVGNSLTGLWRIKTKPIRDQKKKIFHQDVDSVTFVWAINEFKCVDVKRRYAEIFLGSLFSFSDMPGNVCTTWSQSSENLRWIFVNLQEIVRTSS